ncbi:NAD-dependent epimerase [Mangrovimonas yunxiaonensis]|uniref:NAD-dependent epimerase n=1 Tax=Mangrovimonas yunxiaonensis TaxID=1197477 RepID=A0A084TIJ3_9FLAO|nr:TIGR01777 family oxidoreductase [Mangrovimonas yunxiaonensis]KFB00529.1 NAD-dependent epimerase [Mangrovimonas yunxiaonensis]GGH47339.1 NAD-dependent epimerase [Mangrovimonas yunxiaonensis]
MKKLLLTGATGLIGQHIVAQCHKAQIGVHYLTTSKAKITHTENYKGFYWAPETGEIDLACFNGVTAIINLAGASISKRWTSAHKQAILNSRVQALETLYKGMNQQENAIEQLITASAIGVYPDALTKYYEEDFQEVSSSFLGQVTAQWEAAAEQFNTLGITVSKIRIGLVLDADNGALPKMVSPIKYGLGAAFGTGDQWQSWIHITDLARLFLYVFENRLAGVYNGVAPNPVTNSELVNAIARQLHKPLWLPHIPKVFMKTLLGEMHILLYESQRVSSRKITDRGFSFHYHTLPLALKTLLE